MGLMSIYQRFFPGTVAAPETAAPEETAPVPTGWRGLVADQSFWAVLLICTACWLCWVIYVDRFGNSLPYCDEYDAFVMTGIATRETPVTWELMWAPQNEHRTPLTRLWGVWLGRAFNWNKRPMLQVDVALLGVGCLALVLAARSVRGRSHLSDAFLPLLILTSAQFETIGFYVYAYAMTLAIWCLTASAVMAKWQLRSVFHLLLFVCGALIVTWSGGPAGNLWALGLCVPLVLGWFEPTSRIWKACAVLGGLAIAASSAFLIYSVPPSPPGHHPFKSESWKMTFKAASKLSVGWMGGPILTVIWPWALLAVVVPLLYVLVRFLMDVRRYRATALLRWLDLTAMLLPALALLVVIGQARAKMPGLWCSRYCVLEIPVAVTLFFMLIRSSAPKALTSALAIGMAVCVGWNWPYAVDHGRAMRAQQLVLVSELRQGHEPLSVLAEKHSTSTGFAKEWGLRHLLGWWQRMRVARISVFDHDANTAQRCIFLHSDSGTLTGTLHPVEDVWALAGHAVQADPGQPATSAVYEVNVPANGVYKLCCRWQVPEAGHTFAVAFDSGPVMQQPVPVSPTYAACVLGPTVPLEAGKHRITITWPGAGSRLDILELTPQ